MNKFVYFTLIAVFSLLITACPSQPTKYSDPDSAKSRSDRSMQELDRETK